jgi:hypothetical protein
MNSEIIIKPHIEKNFDGTESVTGMFDVLFEGKTAVGVTYDELLGLVSSITMPERRRCLEWLRTPEQIKAWNEKYNQSLIKNLSHGK